MGNANRSKAPKRAEAVIRPEEKKPSKKAVVAAGVLALAVGVGYGVLCAEVKQDQILPQTVVNGVNLSGMTEEAAAAALEEKFGSDYAAAQLVIEADGKEYPVMLGNTLTLDCGAVADEVMRPNRSAVWSRGFAMLKAMTVGTDAFFAPSIADLDQMEKNLEASGLTEINTTVQTGYEVNGEGNLDIHMGTTGHSMDHDGLMELVEAAVAENDYETVIQCPMKTGLVEPLDWKALEADICREASDATLSLSKDRRSYEMVESVTSVSFDEAAAKEAVEAAQEGSTVTVPLVYVEPEITTEDLEEHLFRDILSDYETVVKGSDSRKANVRLAAQKCSEIILLPGESMSYNNTLGERTAENGFFPAPAYLYGKTVMEYGGGICQVSSTLYVATLYANLQIDERHNHTYASSYVPLGMDATVSWGGPDFQFTNNRKYPIKLEVGYWNGYAVARIWGTKTENVSVRIESETLSTKEYSTETRSDPERYEGERYTEQHGVNGYQVQTYRILRDADGNELSRQKEAYSSYTPETEIIRVGTKKRPVVQPKPEANAAGGQTTPQQGTATGKPAAGAANANQ